LAQANARAQRHSSACKAASCSTRLAAARDRHVLSATPGRCALNTIRPRRLLIVADGSVVAMRDTALRTTERTPLRSTPLNIILGENINLERNARIMRVSRRARMDSSSPRATAPAKPMARSHCNFDNGEPELRSWDVIDATGARTRITLSDITQPTPASIARCSGLEDMLANAPSGPNRDYARQPKPCCDLARGFTSVKP
jgi:hypothetical protein